MDLRKDIFFYADLASFPASGAENKLYVDKSLGFIYTWDGSSYVVSSESGLNYLGLWNANTNSPNIQSSVGNTSDYYIVGTAGTTNINGISDWGVGDWIIFSSTGVWQKIDNSETPSINIYNSNGTLTGNRTVDLNSNTLTFSNGIVNFNQGTTNSGEIRLYEDADFGGNYIALKAPQSFGSDISLFLPGSLGTNGQVLTTNGLGVTSWTTVGLTYFTEAQSTAAPNATVNVDSLTAVAATANADIALVPKGTGAFTLAVADNTATGGDKRGTNAVDLQIARTNTNQVASGANSAILGSGNRAYGTNSVAVGISSVAGGVNAIALGYGAGATGYNSVAMAQGSATGTNSIAFGTRAKATYFDSLAMGGYTYVDTTASGQYSTAIGGGNTASGDFSMAWGGYYNIASGYQSYASGVNTNTFSITGRQTRGFGNTANGDCQKSEFYLSKRTTDAIASTLTIGGGASTGSNQVILSNQSAYAFEGKIIGKQSGSTNAAVWKIEGLIVRGANAASTVLTASRVTLFSNLPGWGTPTLAADTTNGGLQIQVAGLAATNIQWTAVIETTEVIYA